MNRELKIRWQTPDGRSTVQKAGGNRGMGGVFARTPSSVVCMQWSAFSALLGTSEGRMPDICVILMQGRIEWACPRKGATQQSLVG